ncbi:hypothetical protein SAMN05421640_1988 [Ekhidna lutea]|uniref:GLPGLI family protein n=1 Tax=Ekhidna lutea TaxID=447679 RepID=A0A239J4P0_EKHLU|nr:hypothetical protein [Ekhidna lutea]SNT00861.1 hypothetical protein SAMN05421640_1988 [Ekhidna lutea]
MKTPDNLKSLLLLCAALLLMHFSSAQELELKSNGYGEKNLKKFPRKVYIKEFNVNFQMTADAKAVSKTTTNSRKGSSSASMNVAVTGIDAPDLQQITNTVYNDFVNAFKSQGFEVLTVNDIGDLKYFEEYELMGANINEDQNPGYLKVTPEGFQYYVKGISNSGKEKQVVGAPMRLLKEMDDVMVLTADYTFSAIDLNASQSSVLGTSSVKGNIGLKMPSCVLNAWAGKMIAINYTPKKMPEFEGVFENEGEKLKAFSMATKPTYSGFLTHSSNDFTHEAKCDKDKYVATTTGTMKEFNNQALSEMFGYFNK